MTTSIYIIYLLPVSVLSYMYFKHLSTLHSNKNTDKENTDKENVLHDYIRKIKTIEAEIEEIEKSNFSIEKQIKDSKIEIFRDYHRFYPCSPVDNLPCVWCCDKAKDFSYLNVRIKCCCHALSKDKIARLNKTIEDNIKLIDKKRSEIYYHSRKFLYAYSS